jgi:hypothetical protein
MRIIENMLGSERAAGKRRVDKGGNLKEEAREDKNGWEGRGMGNRKGVVQRRFERAHHFCRGGDEEKEEEAEEEKEAVEEETLPLFVVAGETKNGG